MWKEKEENQNFIYYTKQTATQNAKTTSYMHYVCQKHGNSTPHKRKTTRRNKKGVVKSGMFCPSRLLCKEDNITKKYLLLIFTHTIMFLVLLIQNTILSQKV